MSGASAVVKKTETTQGTRQAAPRPRASTASGATSTERWQEAAGNLAVQTHARNDRIGPKLRIGQPDDPEEREAERAAELVVRGERAGITEQSAAVVQRDRANCTSDCGPCEQQDDERHLLRKEEAGTAPPSAASAVVSVGAALGPGRPLSVSMRAYFEPRFGRDFGAVRVHTGHEAAASARQLSARAYTLGQNIVFDAGQYAPSSTDGLRLLTHELAHVVQAATGVHRQIGNDAGVSAPVGAAANAGVTTSADAPVDTAATSSYDPGLIGMDGRPSAASPLAGVAPAPAPGADAIGWMDALLSSDEAFMLHQIRARMARHTTLREGEDSLDAWADEFAAAIDRAGYDARDVSGVPDTLSAQRVWIERAQRVLQVLRGTIRSIEVEHIAFEREFLARAELVVAQLLDLSRERVEAEARRYGLVRHSHKTTRMVHDGLARSPETEITYTYSMSSGAATTGLASASRALAAQTRTVEARTREYWDQFGQVPAPSGTFVGEGDTGTVYGCLNEAACAAATIRKTEARQEYDRLRFEKERDFPILASYAQLPREDALWPLSSAAERLEGLARGATTDNAQLLFGEIDEKRRNIERTGQALLDNELVLWELRPALVATAEDMGLAADSWQMRWVNEAAARHASDRGLLEMALGVLAIGLGILAAIPTGGSSLVAAGTFVAGLGAAGLSLYAAGSHLQRYLLDSAASGTDFDKARAISGADPSLFWLAVDIVGAIADVHAAAAAFRTLGAEVRTAMTLRRAGGSADDIARADAAAARRAEEVNPGLGDRVRDGLSREAVREGRRGDAAVLEWEGSINSESRAFLVDHPHTRLLYADMSPRVRQALTFCASVCVVPSATAEQARRLESLLARWGEGDLSRLQQFLHAHADNLEPVLARLERDAADWSGVQHVIAEEAHRASFAPGDNPFAGLREAEIDAAIDEMFSPALAGGSRPTIEGHRLPLRARARLDIQNIPRLAGETARDALARVRGVIGVRLDEIEPVRRCWERARQRVLSQHTLGPSNYADLYDRARRLFWSEVRNDAEATAHFRRAGFEFPATDSSAPMLGTIADVSATEIRVSLDHIAEKAIGDNWRYALDTDNLRMEFSMPNTYREIIQARHPELR